MTPTIQAEGDPDLSRLCTATTVFMRAVAEASEYDLATVRQLLDGFIPNAHKLGARSCASVISTAEVIREMEFAAAGQTGTLPDYRPTLKKLT